MGNYKFRLSDMIPNAWFYKLKDISRRGGGRNSHQNKKKQSSTSKCSTPSLLVSSVSRQHHRQSFYYRDSFTHQQQQPVPVPVPVYQNNPPTDVYFPVDSPRKSSKGKSRSRNRRKTVYKPSPRRVHQDNENCSRACQCQFQCLPESEAEAASFSSNSLKKNYFDSFSSTDASLEFFDLVKYVPSKETGAGTESRSSNCSCGFSSTTDIIIDVNEKCFIPAAGINSDHSNSLLFDSSIPEKLDLPPILTKPTKLHPPSPPPPIKTVKKINRKETPISSRGGIKLRPNSPKLMASKKNQGQRQGISRKSISSSSSSKKVFSESFAVVKASIDPEKDFRESMMEMILENNIKNSKDLEDLLACYLSLNSDEYHQLIINAFEQIWFHIPHL